MPKLVLYTQDISVHARKSDTNERLVYEINAIILRNFFVSYMRHYVNGIFL